MMTVKKILVPTDFSENAQVAFLRACDLARQLKAKLYLLHVQDGSVLRTAAQEGLVGPDSTDQQLQAAIEQLTQLRFSEMLAGLDLTDVPIEHLTLRGYPKSVILDYAKEIHAELVVIGLRGLTAMSLITSAVWGSVADYVIQRSPCLTVVVRLEHQQKMGNGDLCDLVIL
jgi:nucleotide-binding universal stress UspA family protein